MSTDRRRKVDELDMVEEPRQLAVDTANTKPEDNAAPIARRRKAIVSGTNADQHRIYNLIPKGFVPRLVSMEKGRPQKLYEQDWEFVTAEDGHSHVYEVVNSSKGANEVRHVWMMKRKEFYDADAKERARARDRALGVASADANMDTDKSQFFKDVGLSKDDEFLFKGK